MPSRLHSVGGLLLFGLISAGCHPNQPNSAVSVRSTPIGKERVAPTPTPSPSAPLERPTISDPPSSTADSLAQRANTYAQTLEPLLNQRNTKASQTSASEPSGDVQWIDPKASVEVPMKTLPATQPVGPAANVGVTLNETAVSSAPSVASKPAPAKPVAPPVPQEAASARTAAEATSADRSGDPLQARFAQHVRDYPQDLAGQLDLQLLQFLKGESVPDLQTLAPLPGEDRELLSALMDGLSNFRSALRADSNMLFSKKIRPIVDLSDRLRTQAELTIPTVALCSKVVTYGVYTPIEPARFTSGFNEEICAYCEVENFASQLDADKQWETRLKIDVVIYSDQGLELWSANKSKKNASGLVVDRSRNRRRDFFVIEQFRLPKTLVVGSYILKVTVVDQEVNRVAENSIPLEIIAQ